MLLGTVPQSLFFPVLYLERLFEFFNEILTYRIEDVQHNKGLIANTGITYGEHLLEYNRNPLFAQFSPHRQCTTKLCHCRPSQPVHRDENALARNDQVKMLTGMA